MEILILVVVMILLAETTSIALRLFKKSKKVKTGRRKIYVDTSSLIDGRIVDIAKTGFIGDDLLIPRSVIRELQLLADGKDGEKRNVARRGLDNVNELERVVFCETTIVQDALDHTPVDERLITLAKENHGLICTTDYNLNKVAATENIDVLNVNDLAMSLTCNLNLGDELKLKIVEKGDKRGQGIAHLENGSLIIVDHASRDVGKTIDAEITRLYQSPSGLIIFARKKI